MDAAIYQLDAIRSKRATATIMDAFFHTSKLSDGLAMTLAAQSFWAKYVLGLASFHAAIASSALSGASKSRQTQVGPY